MPTIHSTMGLHLHYRLWIAELNSDINVLRIFDDYLKELSLQARAPEVKSGIDHFTKQFVGIRKEIDDLRHEMQLVKMKLGSYSREKKTVDHRTYRADNHGVLKKQYVGFRKRFEKMKKEFGKFEAKWLP